MAIKAKKATPPAVASNLFSRIEPRTRKLMSAQREGSRGSNSGCAVRHECRRSLGVRGVGPGSLFKSKTTVVAFFLHCRPTQVLIQRLELFASAT